MGTRGFVGWKLDGVLTVVYQQFDSYPSGTGKDVAADLRTIQQTIATDLIKHTPALVRDPSALTVATRSALREQFRSIVRLTDDTPVTAKLRERLAPVTNTGVSTGDDIYALTRQLQGNLAGIFEHRVAYHYGDEWPRESLFCEWGYLLDFDADEGLGRFDVYRGFQKATTAGEWAGEPALLEDKYEWVGRQRKTVGQAPSEYFPVNCVRWSRWSHHRARSRSAMSRRRSIGARTQRPTQPMSRLSSTQRAS